MKLQPDFNDPGAYAYDAIEGELPVSISGELDIYTLDDYALVYTATDRYGNSASVNRAVRVLDTTPSRPHLGG